MNDERNEFLLDLVIRCVFMLLCTIVIFLIMRFGFDVHRPLLWWAGMYVLYILSSYFWTLLKWLFVKAKSDIFIDY